MEKIKNKQNRMKLFVLSLALFLSLSFAVAATNDLAFESTSDGEYISGTHTFNISIESPSGSIDNVSVIYQTNDGDMGYIGSKTNDTPDQIYYTFDWDTTAFVDNNYTIGASGYDNSEDVTVSTATPIEVNIDNGNPTAELTSDSIHENYNVRYSDAFVLGIEPDNDIGISSCQLRFTDSTDTVVTSSLSAESNACSSSSLTAENIGLSKGEVYSTVVRAIDGNGNYTDSTTRTLSVASAAGERPGEGDTTQPSEVVPTGAISKLRSAISDVAEGISNTVNNIIDFFRNLFGG